jgi:hypothetical protein
MSQNDAFVSICFNIGQGVLEARPLPNDLMRATKKLAEAILCWDTPSEIIPRRQGEQVQFLGGYVPRITQIGP